METAADRKNRIKLLINHLIEELIDNDPINIFEPNSPVYEWNHSEQCECGASNECAIRIVDMEFL